MRAAGSTLTVGELAGELAGLDPALPVYVTHEGMAASRVVEVEVHPGHVEILPETHPAVPTW